MFIILLVLYECSYGSFVSIKHTYLMKEYIELNTGFHVIKMKIMSHISEGAFINTVSLVKVEPKISIDQTRLI